MSWIWNYQTLQRAFNLKLVTSTWLKWHGEREERKGLYTTVHLYDLFPAWTTPRCDKTPHIWIGHQHQAQWDNSQCDAMPVGWWTSSVNLFTCLLCVPVSHAAHDRGLHALTSPNVTPRYGGDEFWFYCKYRSSILPPTWFTCQPNE